MANNKVLTCYRKTATYALLHLYDFIKAKVFFCEKKLLSTFMILSKQKFFFVRKNFYLYGSSRPFGFFLYP